MGQSELNPWFLAPSRPEWHGGQICYLWIKKKQRIEGKREVMGGMVGEDIDSLSVHDVRTFVVNH